MAKSATIRFIIYWQKEDTEKEIKIVLPVKLNNSNYEKNLLKNLSVGEESAFQNT